MTLKDVGQAPENEAGEAGELVETVRIAIVACEYMKSRAQETFGGLVRVVVLRLVRRGVLVFIKGRYSGLTLLLFVKGLCFTKEHL